MYCSRECRRAHWEKHRKTCLFSRIGSLCRQVISSIKEQKWTLQQLSRIARRGYLAHGRGAVKCFFPCPESAERFLRDGLPSLAGELTYVAWPDLLPSEMGRQLYKELIHMCKHYNPDTKLVLYVSVCVVSETPASGDVKWERQLVSRCAKMRLGRGDAVGDQPETLVLTCQPLSGDEERVKRLRATAGGNVIRELKRRGVSLKRHYPAAHRQLCLYADNLRDKLAPITVVHPPPEENGGAPQFMCIIMLEAHKDALRQVEEAAVQVRTVDVLNDHDHELILHEDDRRDNPIL